MINTSRPQHRIVRLSILLLCLALLCFPPSVLAAPQAADGHDHEHGPAPSSTPTVPPSIPVNIPINTPLPAPSSRASTVFTATAVIPIPSAPTGAPRASPSATSGASSGKSHADDGHSHAEDKSGSTNTAANQVSAIKPADAGHSHGSEGGHPTAFNTATTNMTLLFSSVKVMNAGQYTLACAVAFLISLLNASANKLRIKIFSRGLPRVPSFTGDYKGSSGLEAAAEPSPRISSLRRVTYALFRTVASFISIVVMLLVMTFNVGIIGCILLGTLVAALFWDYNGSIPSHQH
ncbi:hypothetical protein DFS34DRAFT_648212 [Phlyctochytrium arcticum]|nr:hypothetical protein DFS34DRAFT_648212 [Phlyctochytrium arcticum]